MTDESLKILQVPLEAISPEICPNFWLRRNTIEKLIADIITTI